MRYTQHHQEAGFYVRLTDWRPLPVDTGPMHIFALGDIHGRFDVMTSVLDYIAGIPRAPEDSELVLLGDLIDRGPQSMDCLRLGLDGAGDRAKVDRYVRLPGNHEMMLIGAMSDIATRRMWLKNGGEELLDELGNVTTPEGLKTRLKAELGDLSRILSGPHQHRVGGLLFVHGGIHPGMSIDACLAQPPSGMPYDGHWAWVREPFLEHEGPWTHDDSLVVVHGHTPIHNDPGSSAFGRRSSDDPMCWVMIDADECDMVSARRRVNLDTGCGKTSAAVAVAEFLNGKYRLHIIHRY